MVRGWKAPLPTLDNRPVAWFHASSLGEFEQARPVLETYREQHPDSQIVVTFFSPSGYEVRKGYSLADSILYLPIDTPHNPRKLLDAIHPTIAFFVKYDFWYNYLNELHRRGIPTFLFSAIFRPKQYFFRPWGHWFLRQLRRCYRHIFVQNTESLQLLQHHGITHCSIAGDTRFDRVHQIALQAEPNAILEAFLNSHKGAVMIAGSTWPPDEQLLAKAREADSSFPEYLIIAPHIISEDHLQKIEAMFPDSIRYSHFSQPSENHKTLIIDNIGLLSKLYRYADIAYIGGGFGAGIPNILEAVTFGKPVLFGPNYHKFQEAHDIIDQGGGWSISNSTSLNSHLAHLLNDPTAYSTASQACSNYMQHNLGSTAIILDTIEK